MKTPLQNELDKAAAEARSVADAVLRKNPRGKQIAPELETMSAEPPGPVRTFISKNFWWIFLGIGGFVWICVITAKVLGLITLSWVAVTLGYGLILFWIPVALLLLIVAFLVLINMPGFLFNQLFRVLSTNPTKMPVWPYVMFGGIAVPLCILSRTGSWLALVSGIFLLLCFVCGVIAYNHRSENAERRRIALAKKLANGKRNPHLGDLGSSKAEKHATASLDSAQSRAPEACSMDLNAVASSVENRPSSVLAENETSDLAAESSAEANAPSECSPTI